MIDVENMEIKSNVLVLQCRDSIKSPELLECKIPQNPIESRTEPLTLV